MQQKAAQRAKLRCERPPLQRRVAKRQSQAGSGKAGKERPAAASEARRKDARAAGRLIAIAGAVRAGRKSQAGKQASSTVRPARSVEAQDFRMLWRAACFSSCKQRDRAGMSLSNGVRSEAEYCKMR